MSDSHNHLDIIPHLFRTEYSRITAVLCTCWGIQHVADAEDIAAETFMRAYEVWPYKGIPTNPQGWLYTVARNKAINFSKRRATLRYIAGNINATSTEVDTIPELDFSPANINDSQLQMMFAICHPSLSLEAQVSLSLRILCGLGIDEIASAFLVNKDTVNKRLYRARETLRTKKITLCFPATHELETRLQSVLKTLYLLFSEGYYSECSDHILRKDLCFEAMRLTHLLTSNPVTHIPQVSALMSLMCFHASRFNARTSAAGSPILYDDQDTTLWNNELIAKGVYYLHEASKGDSISTYHYEAHIAWWHTQKNAGIEKWKHLLSLYDELLQLSYNPIAAMNRIYALWQVYGAEAAIQQALQLDISNNHYYHTLLGELYVTTSIEKAKSHFTTALQLARSTHDRQSLQQKIAKLGG